MLFVKQKNEDITQFYHVYRISLRTNSDGKVMLYVYWRKEINDYIYWPLSDISEIVCDQPEFKLIVDEIKRRLVYQNGEIK